MPRAAASGILTRLAPASGSNGSVTMPVLLSCRALLRNRAGLRRRPCSLAPLAAPPSCAAPRRRQISTAPPPQLPPAEPADARPCLCCGLVGPGWSPSTQALCGERGRAVGTPHVRAGLGISSGKAQICAPSSHCSRWGAETGLMTVWRKRSSNADSASCSATPTARMRRLASVPFVSGWSLTRPRHACNTFMRFRSVCSCLPSMFESRSTRARGGV